MTTSSDEKKIIFLIVEPSYIIPFWFSKSIEGLGDVAVKHKCTVKQVASVRDIDPSANAIVILGTTRIWIRETIASARRGAFRIILIGAVPSKYGEDISGTMYGSKSTIEGMVRYFYNHHRRRIALIDINYNSSNDVTKYETFLMTARQLNMDTSYSDVYFRDIDSLNPTENFLARIQMYDSVICSNDFSAAYIISYAREHAIKVPEQLFVAGLGDIVLCRYTCPSLTSATRSYYEAGKQVFDIWKTLNQNPDVESIVTVMRSTIKPRGSTAYLPVIEQDADQSNDIPADYEDFIPNVTKGSEAIRAIHSSLSQCDSLDMLIIIGVMKNHSNEKLAEDLLVAPGTINYRLKKLYQNAGVSTKTEFADLFRLHVSLDALIKDSESFSENLR
jgi:DNA-binding LacI/PurR family transcriptional regulator